jgi:hypothetical protein
MFCGDPVANVAGAHQPVAADDRRLASFKNSLFAGKRD